MLLVHVESKKYRAGVALVLAYVIPELEPDVGGLTWKKTANNSNSNNKKIQTTCMKLTNVNPGYEQIFCPKLRLKMRYQT